MAKKLEEKQELNVEENSTEVEEEEQELSEDEQLGKLLDEVEALRKENAQLKENNGSLTSRVQTNSERMKQVLLGRSTITPQEIKKELEETEDLNIKQLPQDYFTKKLDL